MGNSFGHTLVLTSWGESHGPAIGGVLDGVPPHLLLSEEEVQIFLDRRRPGHSALTSPRCEKDRVRFLSGLFEGRTTGAPLAFIIENNDQKSEQYEPYRDVFRPGHADYTYYLKYGVRDHRGGGRASARETAIRVVGGAVARKILESAWAASFSLQGGVIQIGPHGISPEVLAGEWGSLNPTENIFYTPDPAVIPLWTSYLEAKKEAGLSVGALIEVRAKGVPGGLGQPVYDKLDADLAKALMSINAVKGVEIGEGFRSVAAENGYDEMLLEEGTLQFASNKAGGILGGISSGQDIVCRLVVKPTSSTLAPRSAVALKKEGGRESLETSEIQITGRHDPCVGIRAVPVAEAMVALVLADHYLRWWGYAGPATDLCR